jgi:hypothetical protein
MNVFRLHIRPGGGLANPEISFAYCLDKQVLGMGWQTHSEKVISSWEEYETEASKAIKSSSELSRVRFLKNRVKADDLIWTRSPMGNYYLAKVLSGWEYLDSKEAQDADIVNVVRCRILSVPKIDQVPGKIVSCFRATRTIQSVKDQHARQYTAHFWNKLSGSADYPDEPPLGGSIFSFLSAEETEDIIFLYLQTKGWLVIPHTRKADTMRFEFYCIHRETKRRAVVQIKTGNTRLSTGEWGDLSEHVFLFQSNGFYEGVSSPNVETLSPSKIEAFMVANRDILPECILYWLDYARSAPAKAEEPVVA